MLAESEAIEEEDADELESEREGSEVEEAGERERSVYLDESSPGRLIVSTIPELPGHPECVLGLRAI